MADTRSSSNGKQGGYRRPAAGNPQPPHNAAAEAAVLGSMLRDNGIIAAACQVVAKDDFYADAHQKVFQAMLALCDRGDPADLVTVANLLHGRDHIEDVRYPLLGELWDAAPAPANWRSYADIVRDSALRRQLIHAGEHIQREAQAGRGPARELWEAARETIGALARKEPLGASAGAIPASQLATGGAAVDWVWHGYLARGSVTLLTSLWKAGKSTLLAHVVKAMGRGEPMAGLPVAAGKVLLISEESAALWAARRDKLGLGDHALFHIRPFLGRPDPIAWLALIRHVARLVQERDLSLVCFDTLAALSPCDDENDAAKMLAAVTPLHQITEAGAAVLLSHHPRKGDAGEGQASRGSGALPGFVDVILEMRRARASEKGNRQRALTAYSRFDDTPAELVIELAEDGSGYRSLGPPADADRHSRLQSIRDQLPGEAPGKTAEELLGDWPETPRKPGKRTLEEDLNQGAEAGRWSKTGTGKKGAPFRFWANGNSIRAPIPSIDARIESEGQNGEAEWTA